VGFGTFGPVADAVGPIIGGIAAGAAAGLTSSVLNRAAGNNTNIGIAVGLGALAGGLGGGIVQLDLPWAADLVASGLVGGGISELAGGSFAEGFGFAAVTSAVFHYQDIVASIEKLDLSSSSLTITEVGEVAGGAGTVVKFFGKVAHKFVPGVGWVSLANDAYEVGKYFYELGISSERTPGTQDYSARITGDFSHLTGERPGSTPVTRGGKIMHFCADVMRACFGGADADKRF